MASFILLFLIVVLVFLPAVFSVTAVNDTCTSGFLDSFDIDESTFQLVSLPDSSLPNDDPLFDFTQWIFPNINFTCNDNITSWRLRVNHSMESGQNVLRSIPQITTWRLQTSFGGRDHYILQSITNKSRATMIISEADVYELEYTPSQPFPVQAGDMVGITKPSNKMRSVRPLFLKLSEGNSSTISCIRLDDSQNFFLVDRMCLYQQQQQFLYIPLLTAITDSTVDPLPSPSSSSAINYDPSMTFVVNLTPTMKDIDEDTSPTIITSSGRNALGIVIGSVSTGAMALILAVIFIAITAMLCLKHKNNQATVSNHLQQEIRKESDSMMAQLHYQNLMSNMKSNNAYIPSNQQVLIETEDNVAYYFMGNGHDYSNSQHDYESVYDSDYSTIPQ